MIEEGIVLMLKADATMASLIGGRIYALTSRADQPQYPYLVYRVVSASGELTADRKKISSKRIQFDAFGNDYRSVKAVQAALANLLDAFTGPLPNGTNLIFAESTVEIDDFPQDARCYRTICDYEIQYV